MIDNINEYGQTRAWLKANQASNDNSVLIIIDLPLLPLAALMFYSLRLTLRVRNINTAMGNCISSMMKKGVRYGGSSNRANSKSKSLRKRLQFNLVRNGSSNH